MSQQEVDESSQLGDGSLSINDEEEELDEAAHVDYILTADFDVDAGPVISHQYPEPLGGDVTYRPPHDDELTSQMLAELMLPDQVHTREEDWTIFFLHKGPDENEPDGEGGLMYVLSLVNKKLDQSVKR
jgi:Docking domain of Afi1 for Arf3 in vesicle trafficking